jgi:putative nucleotidyltransferase with HDIG domain
VIPEVRQQFRLTPESLAAIRAQVSNHEVSAAWKQKTRDLVEALPKHPLLEDAAYQRESTEGFLSQQVQLRRGDGANERIELLNRSELVSLKDERQLTDAMRRVAEDAGFSEPVLSVVVSRLTTNPDPTYLYDEAVTTSNQNANAKDQRIVVTHVPPGQVIYRRGDVLSPQQLELFRREMAAYASQAEPYQVWLRTMSIFGAVAATALAIAGYLALFVPRVHKHPARVAGVAALMAAALALACAATVLNPSLLLLTAIAPTVFMAVTLVIAYDQRMALAMGTLHGVLTCAALNQPVGVYALILTGVSFAVFQLREIRDRHGILRMGLYAGAALAVGAFVVALIDRPVSRETLAQTLPDAGLAGLGGTGVGVLTLALLPWIERAFDITTGLTLIELRDPKQPLLRQLQQRAPGTYNHSLNVASIAEAAADAIKSDPLLTYVGALYHDIGKMNKPEYFVEKPDGRPQPPRQAQPGDEPAGDRRARQGRNGHGAGGPPAALDPALHRGPPRHDAGGVLLQPGPTAGRADRPGRRGGGARGGRVPVPGPQAAHQGVRDPDAGRRRGERHAHHDRADPQPHRGAGAGNGQPAAHGRAV